MYEFSVYSDKDVRYEKNARSGAKMVGYFVEGTLTFYDRATRGQVFVPPRVLSTVAAMHKDVFGTTPKKYINGLVNGLERNIEGWCF